MAAADAAESNDGMFESDDKDDDYETLTTAFKGLSLQKLRDIKS